MRNRLSRCFFALFAVLVAMPCAFAQEAHTPAEPPKPSISGVTPAAPLIAPNQPITLTGSNFQQDLVVTFADPQGKAWEAKAEPLGDANHAVVLATFGAPGTWKVTAKNPNGPESDAFAFPVANTTLLTLRSPALWAFFLTAVVVTLLIRAIYQFVTADLRKAQTTGQWSFGDALSEESQFQPAEIHRKSDVIMIASTSRLIALLGLLGILMIVVGVGYALMWNLYVFGAVPDLTGLRSFLYGSACLFAPYLANQLSGIFSSKGRQTTQSTDGQGLLIKGIAPAAPSTAVAAQPLHLLGQGFRTGATLTFTDPLTNTVPITGAAITAVDPTILSCNVLLNTAGSWKVAIANPGTAPSDTLQFTVTGRPAITATEPAAIASNANAQKLAFVGSGFMSGLTVELTPPAGGMAQTLVPDSVTATRVEIEATLNTAGRCQAIISNPGNLASAPFSFNVA